MYKILVFVAAAAVSVAASWYRFGDSAHAMGLISSRGGRAHHPVHLPAGKPRYTLVVTTTVLPPYAGDTLVTVKGQPELDVTLSASRPIINLGLRHRPAFHEQTFVDLRPRDRLTLWAVLRRGDVDPVCGHPRDGRSQSVLHAGEDVWFCSPSCREAFEREPGGYPPDRFPTGTYRITFTDTRTGDSVLEIPVIFGGGEGQGSAHEH